MYITLAHPDLITSALGLAHWGERGQGNTLSARTPVSPPSMSVGSITETSVPTLLCLAVRLCSSVLCAVSSVFGEARDMWSNKMAFLLLCTKRESCRRSFASCWELAAWSCRLLTRLAQGGRNVVWAWVVGWGRAKKLGRCPSESRANKAPDGLASRDLVRARAAGARVAHPAATLKGQGCLHSQCRDSSEHFRSSRQDSLEQRKSICHLIGCANLSTRRGRD